MKNLRKKMNNNLNSTFPSYEDLKEFIKQNPRATICEIRDNFNQKGEDI